MKAILKYIALACISFPLSACLTGGFDENPQLDDVNNALAKSPKVDKIIVNGTELDRNSQSVRVVEAAIGAELTIEAEVLSGKSAELTELEVSRQYYWNTNFTEAAQPLEEGTNGFYEITGKSYSFSFLYTVPGVDDDGFAFHPGDEIYVYFRALNDRGNYGYKAFEIHIVE